MEWDKVTDQRDLDVMVSWNPSNRRLTSEDKAVSSRQEEAWVRLRCLVLRLLAVSIDLQPPSPFPRPTNELGSGRQATSDDDKENYNAKEVA
ncbi:hypothetical protein, partial [Salmonella sp. s54395]|uniref:hypothetical protein n=1 Tax=Salmonella sp. s54395 TaxID=3159664 RepID=UPI00397EA874